MNAVYDWVKSIIYYMIFLSVANNLLADSKYEKYIRFFAGLVLMLLVIRPFTGGLKADELLAGLWQRISLESDIRELETDLWGMDGARTRQVTDRYEEAVAEDLVRLARFWGINCESAQAVVERDQESPGYGRIQSISMVISRAEEEETQRDSEDPRPVSIQGEEIRHIRVPPVGTEEGETEAGTEEAEDLKRKVAEYYEVEESHIEIQWKDE
ncbi:MAG: stage III sporulation protein AF [Clostridiales bacterium]|nr:stage III sporulation protein AF [Clostridiales bacterium]